MPPNRADIIDPNIEQRIMETLGDIEVRENVRILHAAESGSRAWGFHSPNSDYDVRFIYARPAEWYLSVYAGRDVIERPIDKIYDVSGWDLKKTLHLAMKSNAVVMEWLQSPVIYQSNDEFCNDLKDFCHAAFDDKALSYHYLNLGTRQIDQAWRTSEKVVVKKYLYMIRPAIALLWLKEYGREAIPPMNVQELMAGIDMPADIRGLINDLIAQKQTMAEKAEIAHIPALDRYLLDIYDERGLHIPEMPEHEKRDIKGRADALFQKWITV